MQQPLVTRPAYGHGGPSTVSEQDSASFEGVVYLVENKINGKRYVGCTKGDLRHRWAQHRSAATKGSPLALHRAIQKYGAEQFQVTVLVTGWFTDATLKQTEIEQIAAQACVAPQGYNLTKGGDGVDYAVPGVRERHLEAMRRLPSDPEWKASLLQGIQRRQEDPQYKQRHLEGVRKSAAERRSTTCTRCAVLLTADNVARRSWCRDCQRTYLREYKRQRRCNGGGS